MRIIEREKTELEKKIYKDVQLEIYKFYDREGIAYNKEKEGPDDAIIDFFSYLYRLIPVTKRNVHYSKELLNKINSNEISEEHIKILKMFENLFLDGKDMNTFLSNNIKKVRKTDFLRYTWHLFHLHMSDKIVKDKTKMKNNRSDTQLLCIIDSHNVYFVDIIPHPTKAEEYFDIRSLEIIVQNDWIEKIGFLEIENMIPGSVEPKIKEDKDIFKLYSECSTNISFEFRGKGYYSFEPVNCMRRPYVAVEKLLKIDREICKLNSVEESYIGFQMGCNEEGRLLGLVEFGTSTGVTNPYNIF